MRKILFSFILLSFLTFGFVVLAQESDLPSPGLTPDSPFYFLKSWKEKIQTFFTFGEENKVKQFLHLADVRLVEYEKMIEKGKTEIAQKTLEKYEKQLNHAIQKIEELKNKGKDVKNISKELLDTTSKHINILERNLQKVPETGKEGIEKALDAARKGTKTKQEVSPKEIGCINSGGTASTSLCCEATGDFPNLCLIGPCGCSPENSHQVKVCDCGPGKCFNGNECAILDQITVKQSGGAGMLISECGDKNYITDKADHIIEGTVEKVESEWDEGKTSIFTYTDLSIEKHVKGIPFAENELQIVTPGGTVGETTQWVEDQPIFHEGKKVRIYFQKTNGEFSIICAQFGVEEI